MDQQMPTDRPTSNPPACPRAQSSSHTACSVRRDGGAFSVRSYGELPCGTCTIKVDGGDDAGKAPVSGCSMNEGTALYCAAACSECCYTRAGTPCEVAADCCAPLVCDTDPGGSKLCRMP
jgi:hypothetical protein